MSGKGDCLKCVFHVTIIGDCVSVVIGVVVVLVVTMCVGGQCCLYIYGGKDGGVVPL